MNEENKKVTELKDEQIENVTGGTLIRPQIRITEGLINPAERILDSDKADPIQVEP